MSVRTLLASLTLVLPAFAQSTLIPVADRRAHVFDPGRRILYLTTERGVLERYDVVADALLAPIPLGTRLNGLDITPDGRFLYVAEDEPSGTDGVLYRLDLATGSVSTLLYPLDDFPFESGSMHVAIGNAGKALLTTHPCQFCSGFAYLREVDLASGVISRRLDVTFGQVNDRTYLARGSDRSRILVVGGNNSSGPAFSYVCASNTFTPSRGLGDFLSGVAAVNRDGSLLAVEISGTRIYDAALNPLHTFVAQFGGVIFDALRDLVYAVDYDADQLIVFETTTFGEVDRLDAGEDLSLVVGGPLGDGAMSVSPAGDFLFLSTTSGVRAFVIGPVAPAVLASTADRVPHDQLPGQVAVTGRFFTQGTGTRVFFGANEAAAVQVVDDFTLLATPPSGVPGPVDVRVTSSAGEGVLRDGFVYTPGVRVRGLAELGQRLLLDYLTTPNGGVIALYGPGPAVALPTRYGILCIDPAVRLFRLAPSPLPTFTLAIDIPSSASLIGANVLFQALVGTSAAQARLTNCASITIQ